MHKILLPLTSLGQLRQILQVFLASPGKLSHCAEKAACTLGRQHLGKLLWDLAIEGKLLELWKTHMPEAVMPSHELSLIVGRCKLDVLGFFG